MADGKDRNWGGRGRGGGSLAYLLALIGAMVYFIQQAHGFWPVVLAILKAIVWPVFLVYDVLKFIHAG
ncbi:MAG: hypothetical protein J2P15_04545 [Micromonosporaceae bacterium]|nr:hypothetical protein [Micromonosporaceae bacterium]